MGLAIVILLASNLVVLSLAAFIYLRAYFRARELRKSLTSRIIHLELKLTFLSNEGKVTSFRKVINPDRGFPRIAYSVEHFLRYCLDPRFRVHFNGSQPKEENQTEALSSEKGKGKAFPN